MFGGGIGSVAGGALGGVLGTIGGGSGFGAQILASAIGTQVEAFATATAEAGQALNSTSGAFDLLTEKSLFSSEETERLANQLAELGEVEKLATLLTKDLVDIIGNEGVEKLQTLGDTTNETTRLWGQLTLQLQALISGPLNGFLSLVNDFLGRIVNPARYRNLIRENPEARARAEELRGPRRGRDAAKNRGLTEAQIQAQILKEFDPIVTVDIPVTPEDRTRFAPPTPKAPGVDKAAREEARIQERLAQLRIETELIKDQTALIQEQTTARIDNNKLNQIDIEALVKSVELEARKQRTLVGVTDARERAAINAKFEAEQTRLTTQAIADQAVARAALNDQINEAVIRFENEVALINERNEEAREFLKIEQAIAKLQRDNPIITSEQISKYREAAQGAATAKLEQKKYNESLKEAQRIVTPVVGSLVNGLRAVVAGTKTAEQAFADFLTSIADQLVQTAATMIAQYIAIGIAKRFAGLDSPQGPSFGSGTNTGLPLFGDLTGLSGVPYRAAGGPVAGNQPYIVGESGPELFVPGVSGAITNNDQFEAARNALSNGATGGSADAFTENSDSIAATNSYVRERTLERESTTTTGTAGSIVVETQVINNVEYASVEQLEKATALSAKQARAQVFNDLKNKPSKRAMVGMR